MRASARLTGTSALLASLALVACGGGSGDAERETRARATTESTETLGKADFLARGDALCADVQAEASQLARRAVELQDQAEALPQKEFFRRAAEVWSDQIELIEGFRKRFEALGAPPEDEARIRAFLQTIDDGVVLARDIKATLDRGEEVPPTLVARYSRVVAKGNTLAQAYGFEVCGATQAG